MLPQLQAIIAPSILNADPLKLGKEVSALTSCGITWLHIDIMDGDFVDNLSFSASTVAALRKASHLHLDVHLMVKRLDRHTHRFAAAGADRITIHPEADPDWRRAIKSISDLGCTAGIAIKPQTPPSIISEVKDDIDLVTVMGVEPGFGGQTLLPQTADRIRACRAIVGQSCHVQVDGGVRLDNCASLYRSGANVLVIGSAILGQNDYAAAIAAIHDVLA